MNNLAVPIQTVFILEGTEDLLFLSFVRLFSFFVFVVYLTKHDSDLNMKR